MADFFSVLLNGRLSCHQRAVQPVFSDPAEGGSESIRLRLFYSVCALLPFFLAYGEHAIAGDDNRYIMIGDGLRSNTKVIPC